VEPPFASEAGFAVDRDRQAWRPVVPSHYEGSARRFGEK
jgi:hypothetical protein